MIPSLYALLEYFSLWVPSPLLQPDSAREQIRQLFHQLCQKYESYHQLTAGGLTELSRMDWGGSPLKLETFLTRLILESSRRSIDEITVSRLLQAIDPPAGAETAAPSPEAEKILEALKLHGGSRPKHCPVPRHQHSHFVAENEKIQNLAAKIAGTRFSIS